MEQINDVFNGYGIQIKLKKDFNYVRDLLSRIGIANHKNKSLVQTCHIFHKRGEYAIMHFLEMFAFDGKDSNFNETDAERRDSIVDLLAKWDIIEILDEMDEPIKITKDVGVSIISKQDVREGWSLIQKYTLGKKTTNETSSYSTAA